MIKLHVKKYHSLEESLCQLLEMHKFWGYNEFSCEVMFQTLTPVSYTHLLPFYITERYDMRLAELDDIRCIFLSPKKKLNQIGSLKKQIRRIQMEESLPVVFVFDKMDCYHRDAFIHAHLPFIVVGIQLYLPFMGIYLQEKYIKEIKTSDTFQPFTQLLLFYLSLIHISSSAGNRKSYDSSAKNLKRKDNYRKFSCSRSP